MRSIGKKFFLMTFSLAAGLLVCEAVVSKAGVAPEVGMVSRGRYRFSSDPTIGYEPTPFHVYSGDKPGEFTDRTNSLGFRDREHSVARQAGVGRILVLGDSVSMGLTTKRFQDIWPVALERELRRRGRKIEVINFGVAGYNTQQEVGMLRQKGLAFAPDLVVLQYSMNDTEQFDGGIMRDLKSFEAGSGKVERSLLSPILVRSALYRLVYFNLFPRNLEEKKRARDRQLARLEEDTVDESFALLRRTAEENGFPVLVVVFPYFNRQGVPNDDLGMDQYPRIARLSRANGFEHLDLWRPLADCAERTDEVVGVDFLHPSALGHACAAETVARTVIDRDLVR